MTVDTTTSRPRQAAGRWVSRRPAGHVLGVGALTALMAAVYCVFSLTLNYTLTTSSYDLVIFDEAVRSYAHLQPGISVIKGDHNGFGPHFSVLGDHWSPILASLAPLYWIYNGPQTLLVAQAVLFALAVPPLWLFTRRAFGGGRKATAAAYLVSVAYALSWPLVEAAFFDFHEVAFAPVLTAVALERLQAGRLRSALIALAGLLLVKEDMGLFVAGTGAFLIVQQFMRQPTVPRQRLVGLALIIIGLIDTEVAVYVLIPAFGGRSDYYWAYDELGRNVPQVVAHMARHPVSSARILLTPGEKVGTYLWLLAPLLFLPLLSPITIPVIPLLLERMLNIVFPAWWGLGAQYNAYLVIVLVIAAVDGAARLDRRIARARPPRAAPSASRTWRRAFAGPGGVALACCAAMAAIAVALVPHFELGAVFTPRFYHRTAQETAGAEAAAAVPGGVTVEATNHIGPQLSARDTVLLWDGDGTSPLYPPWVVASVTRMEFSFPGIQAQVRRVRLLERHGYRAVFDRGGYLVLRSPGATRQGAAR